MRIISMGNHVAAGVSQNGGVLVVQVPYTVLFHMLIIIMHDLIFCDIVIL